MKISGFCDLNVCIPSHQFKKKCIEHLVSLGYKTIALNTLVEEEIDKLPKKKKGQSNEVIPVPQPPLINEEVKGKLQILQRITFPISDANQLQKFSKSDTAKKYDIISVIPKSFNAFQLACACKDIDLISFDACDRPMLMNHKSYNLAVSNGIYFEIPYAPAISDSSKRKYTIQTAHGFHIYGKSKNVIITSGASDIFKTRSPYDVINLGLLFGLSEEQAKHSMLNTSRALIHRAEGRRYGRTAMTMMITDLDLESEGDSDNDTEPVAKRSKTTLNTDTEMAMVS